MVSSWSEPDFGGRWKAGVEFVVKVADPFVIVLVPHFVPGVGGMSPPAVEEEGKEEGIDGSGVKMGSMNVKDTVSLEG